MRLLVVTFCLSTIIFVLLPIAISSSFTILNSVGKDCDEETGKCVEICEFEDFKLFPGTADANNTKCLAVFCSEDFTLTVHTCIHEENPSCTYSHNYKQPFPDCCNKFCQSIVQLN